MEGSTREYITGPPEAYHVGSERTGVVKKVMKRSVHVIMPLHDISNDSMARGQDHSDEFTYIEAAKKVNMSPTLSGQGILSFASIGQGSTIMATSVARLGIL